MEKWTFSRLTVLPKTQMTTTVPRALNWTHLIRELIDGHLSFDPSCVVRDIIITSYRNDGAWATDPIHFVGFRRVLSADLDTRARSWSDTLIEIVCLRTLYRCSTATESPVFGEKIGQIEFNQRFVEECQMIHKKKLYIYYIKLLI